MKGYLRQIGILLWKDLVVEMRTLERLSAMGAFVVLAAVLYHYAFDAGLVRLRDLAGGLLWLTLVLGGLLGLARTFRIEEEDAALRGVLLAPVPRDAVFLAKTAANTILLLVVAVLVWGALSLFFSVPLPRNPLAFLGVLALGTVGFAALGTLFSAISHRTTMGETLLPVLVFPLMIPVVTFGAGATSRLLAGRPLGEVSGSIRLLAAFALVSLLAGAVLFRHVVED